MLVATFHQRHHLQCSPCRQSSWAPQGKCCKTKVTRTWVEPPKRIVGQCMIWWWSIQTTGRYLGVRYVMQIWLGCDLTSDDPPLCSEAGGVLESACQTNMLRSDERGPAVSQWALMIRPPCLLNLYWNSLTFGTKQVRYMAQECNPISLHRPVASTVPRGWSFEWHRPRHIWPVAPIVHGQKTSTPPISTYL